MGITMGLSLLGNNSNVGQDVGLAGIGSFVGSNIRNPIFSAITNDFIQKIPTLKDNYLNSKEKTQNDEK